MPLPHPTALVRMAQVLCALDARIHADDPVLRSYRIVDQPDGTAYYATNGGGDRVVVFVLDSGEVLVKAFDHESPDSPWARDPELPDPALVEGMPTSLQAVIEREVFDLEGFERTWCAWWTGEDWVERGNDDAPVHLFVQDADEILEWLEEDGFTTDEETLGAVLTGSRPVEDVVFTDVVPETPDITGLPEGFTPGQAFCVALSPARPASGFALIKIIRGITGAPLLEIKNALADAEPVYTCTFQRHSYGQHQRLTELSTLIDALSDSGSQIWWVQDERRTPVSRATFRKMMGSEARLLDDG